MRKRVLFLIIVFEFACASFSFAQPIIRLSSNKSFKEQVSTSNTTFVISDVYNLRKKNRLVLKKKIVLENGERCYSQDSIVKLSKGQRLWVPQNCFLLDLQKKNLNFNKKTSVYQAQSDISVYIASKRRRTVSICLDEIVELPENCNLDFKGGKLINGLIIGNNTSIFNSDRDLIFEDVYFAGTFNTDYFSERVYKGDDSHFFCALNTLQSNNKNNTIEIVNDHNVSLEEIEGDAAIILKSNTKLIISSTLKVLKNNRPSYRLIYAGEVSNVEITGNGILCGDVDAHVYSDGSTHEWGRGIYCEGVNNLTISNITCRNFTGDGINIGGGLRATSWDDYSKANKNIIIEEVTVENNRRNNITIGYAAGVQIKNSTIINCGLTSVTSPGVGIDIEPNQGSYFQNVKDITVEDCNIIGNKNGSIAIYGYRGDLFDNIKIRNCKLETIIIGASNIIIEKCKGIESIEFSPFNKEGLCDNITISDCDIEGYGFFWHKGENLIKNVFVSNCRIVANPKEKERREYQKGLLSIYRDIYSPQKCVLVNCDIVIPKEWSNSYCLNKPGTNCQSFTFNNCRIKHEAGNGVGLRLDNMKFSHCNIDCGYLFFVLNDNQKNSCSELKGCTITTHNEKFSLYCSNSSSMDNYAGDISLKLEENIINTPKGTPLFGWDSRSVDASFISRDNILSGANDNSQQMKIIKMKGSKGAVKANSSIR